MTRMRARHGAPWLLVALLGSTLTGCAWIADDSPAPAGAADAGVRRIPIRTPRGEFAVWTRRVGDNPAVKVLLLHGGPGATHEYLQPLAEVLPRAGFEVILYDQLGSAFSDQPDAPELWTTARFVDEVEQVRRALGLDRDDFVLFGHSWGGILAMEYALAHQEHLKGLVLSNMMASIPAYNEYARAVLEPEMDQAALAEVKRLEAEGKTGDPRYMELLVPMHYEKHVLRRKAAEWPDYVTSSFEKLNHDIYVRMQGPSELGASGLLLEWDRFADLARIDVPALVIAARHDTMDPAHLEKMARRLPRGRYHLCPEGSHMAFVDDREAYFAGLTSFLADLERAVPRQPVAAD